MGYDPVTGQYTEEDASVEKRMTGLLDKDSKYMQQAATTGAKQANRRGLLNSTMGVSAVEDSRIKAALPIASQEASQAFQSNQNARQLQVSEMQHQRGIASQEGMQARDIASREGMQQADIQWQRDRLSQELGSRERLQELELLARREMQGEELSSRERMQLQDLQAAQARLSEELASREMLAGMDRDLRERLQAMDLASGDLRAAATLMSGYEAAYANTVAGIMANTEIPAAERQRYLDHAARVRDSNINLLQQLFNVELQWSGVGSSAPTRPPGPYGPGERDIRDYSGAGANPNPADFSEGSYNSLNQPGDITQPYDPYAYDRLRNIMGPVGGT